MEGEFHSRDGLYFSRDDEGNVTVRVVTTIARVGHVEKRVTLPPNEWASVVAAVCARDEDGGTYKAALDFHEAR